MSQAGARSTFRIGTRKSPLAVCQSGLMQRALEAAHPGLQVKLEMIVTTGDRQQDWNRTPAQVGEAGGKGIFVKEIEEALLDGRIDAAVHSMKDVPSVLPKGLHLASMPAREDPRDALVTRAGGGLAGLEAGSRIGTGSPRRSVQIRARRPDLIMVPIRGNVGSRIDKVARGELDGVVVAMAGLNRLGLKDLEVSPIPVEECVPAAGQGILALEAREADRRAGEILRSLDDRDARICAAAERAFLAELGGGCLVPAGALATLEGDALSLRIALGDMDGSRLIRSTARGTRDNPEALGRDAARSALQAGGREILKAVREPAGG